MVDLKQIHVRLGVRRHTAVHYLWQARCCCGHYVLAPTEERAREGIDAHIASEEPFPDMGLSNDASEEPNTP